MPQMGESGGQHNKTQKHNSEVLTSGGGHAAAPADGGADVSVLEDTTARDVDGANPAVLYDLFLNRPACALRRLIRYAW